jgi:hypothetical protein
MKPGTRITTEIKNLSGLDPLEICRPSHGRSHDPVLIRRITKLEAGASPASFMCAEYERRLERSKRLVKRSISRESCGRLNSGTGAEAKPKAPQFERSKQRGEGQSRTPGAGSSAAPRLVSNLPTLSLRSTPASRYSQSLVVRVGFDIHVLALLFEKLSNNMTGSEHILQSQLKVSGGRWTHVGFTPHQTDDTLLNPRRATPLEKKRKRKLNLRMLRICYGRFEKKNSPCSDLLRY